MFIKQTDVDTLVIGAPAKVNLFLQVLRKREDGYHDINSLFQAVSLFDRLQFRRVLGRPVVQISLKSPSVVPLGEDNLICRAYRLMQQRFGLSDGLDITLEKNIPIAAGLAGGSTDAAATISACNILFGLGLGTVAMAELGLQIGSDVPFFFSRGQALVTGRGEKITEVSLPVDYWMELVTPDVMVSTAEAYRSLSLGLTTNRNPVTFRSCKELQGLVDFLKDIGNDFEETQLKAYPQLSRIKDELSDRGAVLTRMSGSGPTVFGIYTETQDEKSKRFLSRDDSSIGKWQATAVRPIVLPARLP
jgi:4-diphosphocytidyl-2-C-methyl-D-erythritol kinase